MYLLYVPAEMQGTSSDSDGPRFASGRDEYGCHQPLDSSAFCTLLMDGWMDLTFP